MIKQKLKSLRVSDETGNAFITVADFLNIDKNDLLEKIMASYIESVRVDMIDRGAKHPQFATEYPFTQ
ncbi:MAG: hypothetical protein ACI8PB_004209 [Desulforhopalus sp.]|jgi:hypothetical protein